MPEARDAIEEVIPTSAPDESTRAPPELPGLIAALVWMAEVTTTSLPWLFAVFSEDTACVVTGRFRAETMPVVTVSDSPRGLPTAITGCPTLRPEESPQDATVRSDGGFSSFSTARSVEGSVPTTLAA